MSGWTLTETHPTQGRTFQRPLDPVEVAFSLFGRTYEFGDILCHAELRLLNPAQDTHLFSEAIIIKAWLSTKRHFPLAGASVQAPSDTPVSRVEGDLGFPSFTSGYHFVVREHDLAVLRPHEVVFGEVASAEEVPQQMSRICDGPRPLSDELLVQLYVFRETDSNRKDVLHFVLLLAHCVVDGTAGRTFMRCLFDTLARGGESDLESEQVSLEERLAMVIRTADRMPVHLSSLSLARRRWRGAVGFVMAQLRLEKGQGSHTLPRRRMRAKVQSGVLSTKFTQAQTTTVLSNCRLHGLTFGTAYAVLAQVAMTRVLYRRYLRGDISEEEWAYRKQQPNRMSGPLNLRPRLDKQWYESGGGGEFNVCVSRYHYQLPFMTLGRTEPHQYREDDLSDGAPPFSDLLTFDRFLHRVGSIKEQARAFFGHPLFFEITHAMGVMFGRTALQYARSPAPVVDSEHGDKDEDDGLLQATSMPSVYAYEVSTLGNLDLILPSEYPLPSTHPLSPFSAVPHPSRTGYPPPPPATESVADATPRIVVENTLSRLHVFPSALYLDSFSLRGLLELDCFYDGHVYEEGMVKEWLEEVKAAVLWYLGQTHRSMGDRRSQDGVVSRVS